VAVVDVPVPEKFAQSFPVELGIVPGPGNGPDVHQPLHAIGSQQLNEFLEGPRRMAHGEDPDRNFSGFLHPGGKFSL
jgi:hypothetical protein